MPAARAEAVDRLAAGIMTAVCVTKSAVVNSPTTVSETP